MIWSVWFGSVRDNIHLKLLWKFHHNPTCFGCFREDLELVWSGLRQCPSEGSVKDQTFLAGLEKIKSWFGMVWFETISIWRVFTLGLVPPLWAFFSETWKICKILPILNNSLPFFNKDMYPFDKNWGSWDPTQYMAHSRNIVKFCKNFHIYWQDRQTCNESI